MPRTWFWLQLCIGWLPVGALFTVMMMVVHQSSLLSALWVALRMISTAALLGWFVHRLAERRPWPWPFRFGFAWLHLGAALLYAAAWLLLNAAFEGLLHGHFSVTLGPGTVPYLITGVWLYVMVAGVAYANQSAARAARSEALAARTQLAALRSQLQPHFLFNALHTVVQLIRLDPGAATRAAEELAGLLRSSLDQSEDLISLRQEWAFVQRYLALESLRLGERLQLVVDLPENTLDLKLPSLALQTLVENALQHAVAPRVERTRVRIEASMETRQLLLKVSDDAPLAAVPELDQCAGTGLRLASDEHPRLIRKFGQSLVSRMLAGMVVRVETPDPGTRHTLAERLSLRRGLRLAPEASTVISERCVGGAREIEGILSRVDAMRAVTSVTGPVSAGEVRAIFHQDDAQRGTQPVRLPEILATTCQHLGVEPDQLRGGGRHRRVALARGLVAWLARDLTAMSFPEIARGLGREAHSAVHGACARVQSLLDADARVDAGPAGEVAVRELTARLRHTLRGTSRG